MVYVTNMSRLTVAEQEQKLAGHGIDAEGRVISSALAAAKLCSPGERALVVGGPGINEALALRDVEVVDSGDIDVVVVGMDPTFGYDDLKRASLAVRGGARLLATNHDPTFPTPEGQVPGAGALVAAIETASEVSAEIAGKPNQAIADLVSERLGSQGMVVGDRPDTDGEFAVTLGYEFALVLSGVTSESDLPVAPSPKYVAADIATLVRSALA